MQVRTRAVVVATFLWLIFTQGPVIWLRTRWHLDGDIADDPAYLVLVLGTAAVCAALVVRHRSWRGRERPLAAVGALLGLLLVSTIWSIDRSVTFLHGVRLVGTVAVVLALVTLTTRREQILGLWLAIQAGCLFSAVQIQRLAAGTQDDDEHWVGIYVNRNLLGLVATVGISVGLLVAWDMWAHRGSLGRRRMWIAAAVLAFFVLLDARLLFGSRSATPVGAFLAGSVLVGVVLLAGRRRIADRWVTAGAVVIAGGVAVSAVVLPHLASAFGRGGNLSRRVPLWDFVTDKIADRPLIGYGYLGGWHDKHFRREMRHIVHGRDLVSAHNSVLEVMLGAGVLALVAVLVVLVFAGRSALRSGLAGGALGMWPLVALSWFAFESLTETFVVADTLPFALLLLALLALPAGDDRI